MKDSQDALDSEEISVNIEDIDTARFIMMNLNNEYFKMCYFQTGDQGITGEPGDKGPVGEKGLPGRPGVLLRAYVPSG